MIPTIQKKIRFLDLYSKPPKSLSIPSISGALLSLIAISLTIILLLSELHIYNQFHYKTSHEIKPQELGIQVNLYLEVLVNNIPCWAIQSNQREGGESWIFMTPSQAYASHTHTNKKAPFKQESEAQFQNKTVADFKIEETDNKNGGIEGESVGFEKGVLKEFENGKAGGSGIGEWQGGCLVEIWQKIDMTPGNLQIGVRGDLERTILQKNWKVDMSHQIKEMRFGDHQVMQTVQQQFPINLKMETLKNYDPWEYRNFIDKMLGVFTERDRTNIFYEYYIIVIQSEFKDLKENIYLAVINLYQYEYAVNTQQFKTQMGGLIDIKYDFSPNIVSYQEINQSLEQFIVRICGIVGGIFSVAGIIDALIHQSMHQLIQKHQMNKLR